MTLPLKANSIKKSVVNIYLKQLQEKLDIAWAHPYCSEHFNCFMSIAEGYNRSDYRK
jgi:hypothetical protein